MNRGYTQSVDKVVEEWIARLLPLPSQHFVYNLCGFVPGKTDEEALAHIYVGVTSNLPARLRDHARKQWWWVAVVPDLCELVPCSTREEANEVEKETIHIYQPAMNRAGRLLVVGAS